MGCLLRPQEEQSKIPNPTPHWANEKIVKHDLAFTLKRKKVRTRIESKGDQLRKRRFTKKQNKAEDLHKDFHLKALNEYKADISHAHIFSIALNGFLDAAQNENGHIV